MGSASSDLGSGRWVGIRIGLGGGRRVGEGDAGGGRGLNGSSIDGMAIMVVVTGVLQ